jgi:hypothetical protein
MTLRATVTLHTACGFRGCSAGPGTKSIVNADHFRRLFKFHPHTGIDAEDFSGFSDQHKQDAAEMMRKGCRFFWQSDTGEEYHRVELSNFKFVCDMTGVELEINSEPPKNGACIL